MNANVALCGYIFKPEDRRLRKARSCPPMDGGSHSPTGQLDRHVVGV
jgi:hypothetical protein